MQCLVEKEAAGESRPQLKRQDPVDVYLQCIYRYVDQYQPNLGLICNY